MSIPKPRIAVGISGTGSNMVALAEKVHSGELHAEIAAVFSDREDAAGIHKATALGIPVYVFPYAKLGRQVAEAQLNAKLRALDIQFIVLAGFMRLLSATFINGFTDRIYNIHPSLLPRFKGMHAIADAFHAGETVTGVTVHLVTEEMDAGRIIAQQEVPIQPEDDFTTLKNTIHSVEHTLYWKTLNDEFVRNAG